MTIKTAILTILLSLLTIFPAVSQESGIMLFDGAWTGKWVSGQPHRDNAPMQALIQADISTNTVTFIMFQTPEPPAPSYSSMSIGMFKDGKVFIDSASSGIAGGGTEMVFWLEGPMLLKGTYKNEFDSGTFEFKRTGGKEA